MIYSKAFQTGYKHSKIWNNSIFLNYKFFSFQCYKWRERKTEMHILVSQILGLQDAISNVAFSSRNSWLLIIFNFNELIFWMICWFVVLKFKPMQFLKFLFFVSQSHFNDTNCNAKITYHKSCSTFFFFFHSFI